MTARETIQALSDAHKLDLTEREIELCVEYLIFLRFRWVLRELTRGS